VASPATLIAVEAVVVAVASPAAVVAVEAAVANPLATDIVVVAPSPAGPVAAVAAIVAANPVGPVAERVAAVAVANPAVLVAGGIAAGDIAVEIQEPLDSRQEIAFGALRTPPLHALRVHDDHCECGARHKGQRAQRLARQ